MKKQYQLTVDGKKELEIELETLKSQRVEIAERIANARDYGDLRENTEYDSAREEQARQETRIAEIEEILLNAQLITNTKSTKIHVGSKVELKLAGKVVKYIIVGPVEADPLEGKISDESPIGAALIGKKVGESVVITTPKGEVTYEIVGIN